MIRIPVEIVGQQLRIRLKSPKLFKKFRIHDVGKKGYLQRVAGYRKGRWETQGWRLNLSHYKNLNEVFKELEQLRLPSRLKNKAKELVFKWWHWGY